MQLTSPLFTFLFLPLSLGIYCVVPHRHKRLAIMIISIVHFLLANWMNPAAVFIMFAMVGYVYLMSRAIDRLRGRSRLHALIPAVAIIVAALITLRLMNRYGYNFLGIGYPFGAAVYFLSAISCLVDVKRGDAPPPDIFTCILYITYFPIMVAGPIIKYKNFSKIFSDIEFTVANVALGIRYYTLGYIKRIAIAAVFDEMFQKIVDNSPDGYSFPIGVLLVTIISIMTYAMFSGYSDMAYGISRMYGVKLIHDFGNPLAAVTPINYARSFITSLYGFGADYIRNPLVGNSKSHWRKSLGFCLICLFSLSWFRSDWRVIVVMLPFIGIGLIMLNFVADRKIKQRFPTRMFGRLITVLITSFYWSVVRTGNPLRIFSMIAHSMSKISLYTTISSMKGISIIEIILVAVITLIVLIPSTRIPVKLRGEWQHRLSNVYIIVICFIFVFTVVYYLPQYPACATSAIDGIFR